MREKSVCRRCESFHHMKQAGGGRKPFAIAGSRPQYAPDLPFRVEHILLDVQVDPMGKKLSGTVTQTVRTIAADQKFIRLDQVGLLIAEAKVGGKSVPFTVEGNSLRISLEAAPPKQGDVFEFSVRYSLSNPRRGLYFTGPDANYPKKRYQAWTQGQDEDSRYWFPSFDYPNQKATSEVIATVPRGFTAVSNGALLSKKEEGEFWKFHYRLGTPHVTYLICLTVAEFSEWAAPGPRGLPILYYVEPGREADGKRAFGNTPKMIEAYEKKIGVPYPYEKYSQVAVQDFIFGGMENTSATTQTDLTLHDERAHLDFTSDGLVAHELAHQWFGDLLTCRDWSHGWLNEGFATFMERVWVENKSGPDGGWEEAKYYSFQDLKDYFDEDGHKYRRPIVCNTYIEPIDLFDTHLYQKGGLVLNLLRGVLGEEQFWRAISLYVTRHKGQSVETLDLIRAVEDATGRNLRRFFDEWVFGAGYPEFELSYQWHDDKKMAEISIEQKQTEGKPFIDKDGARTHLFHVPATVELTLASGETVVHRMELGEARERVFIPAPSKPVMARFDRENWIPKSLKFPRPKELLLHQLKNDRDCMGRIEAAKELMQVPDAEVTRALGEALLSDPFWGAQAEIADALAKIRTDAARDALIAGLAVSHPKARRGVVKALGSFKESKVAEALRKFAEKDASYYVEAEATQAYISARFSPLAKVTEAEIGEGESFLLSQLSKESYREVIRSAALRAMADLPGIREGARPAALQALRDWAKAGQPNDARLAAADSLAKIARVARRPEKAAIFEALDHLADEENFRLRMMLVHALHGTESSEAIGILQKIDQIEIDGRVRRNARTAVDDLRSAGETPESVENLKTALAKLEDEHRKLKAVIEEMKATGAARI